jgi:hypothetical protein
MEGAGILTALALLLLAPFQIMQAHAQKMRLLSPHELHLRLATRPLGVVALLAWVVWLFGAPGIGHALAPVVLHPSDNWLLAVLLGGVLLYGLASFVTGASRCWGMRSDGMLPLRAFFKLAVGVGGLRYLWLWNVDLARGFDVAPGWVALWLLLVAASIWCGVVGAARFLLLTTGGGSALRKIKGIIAAKNAPMIAVRRRRPWWMFWKFW